MKRAYSLLTLNEKRWDDDEEMTLEGMATTPTPDRMNDTVNPKGARFSLPMPALMFHDHGTPVGKVVEAKATDKGIKFKMVLPRKGVLPEIDRARALVQEGIVRAVSIGFRSIKESFNRERGGYDFDEWEWLELSLVSVPANAEATIASVKSLCQAKSPASRVVALSGKSISPGVSGQSTSNPKGTDMKTTAELITEFQTKRVATAEKASAIMSKANEEGRTLDQHETEQFDECQADIKAIDEHLSRLKTLESINIKAATVVADKAATSDGASIRGGYITVQRNVPKGTAFTRYVMALCRSKGNLAEASHFADAQVKANRWDDTPEVARVIKAAADAGTTTDADWASKLVDYQTLAGEFVDLLRPMTILGRFGAGGIPSLRRVPFNVRMATQTSGGTYGWVGEGAAKPVGELAIGEILLRWAKAAGIIVVTDELMRMSNPSVEAVVRNDMLRGMAQFSDGQFIDPDVAEVSNVSPASITNGVTPVPASGTTAEDVRRDVGDLWETFFTANLAPTTGVWIMSNRMAMRLSLMRNALDQKEFPDLTPLGGIFEGYPVIASEAVPDDSNGGILVFVNADDIFYSDDGPVTIDASREASLQMNTTPDNPTTASTVLVSLWQRNLIALRAERYMNWKKRRSAAVGYISGARYGQSS